MQPVQNETHLGTTTAKVHQQSNNNNNSSSSTFANQQTNVDSSLLLASWLYSERGSSNTATTTTVAVGGEKRKHEEETDDDVSHRRSHHSTDGTSSWSSWLYSPSWFSKQSTAPSSISSSTPLPPTASRPDVKVARASKSWSGWLESMINQGKHMMRFPDSKRSKCVECGWIDSRSVELSFQFKTCDR
jgi:hypothetical protein